MKAGNKELRTYKRVFALYAASSHLDNSCVFIALHIGVFSLLGVHPAKSCGIQFSVCNLLTLRALFWRGPTFLKFL
jgi:hypothetical protein